VEVDRRLFFHAVIQPASAANGRSIRFAWVLSVRHPACVARHQGLATLELARLVAAVSLLPS